MKTVKSALILAMAMILSLSLTCTACTAEDPQPDFGGCEKCHRDITENFTTSLHHTGLGMFNEYEGGAMGHFGLNTSAYYEEKNCQKCHVQKCTQCHIGEDMYDLHTKKVTMDACDPCHKKKQTSTFVGEMPMHKPGDGLNADVHYEKGLICTDCHGVEDLHGDGNEYKTQLDAVNTECEDCHTDPEKVVKGMAVTQYTFEQRAHQLHVGKLDCIACHTGWSLTCNKCHLETRKGTKPVSDEFYLGVAADGLVTTFLKMDASYNNETHTGYGEWFSHTITADAKDCDFCHEDREVLCEGCEGQIIGEGGSFISQETIDRIYGIDTAEKSESEPVGIWVKIRNWIKVLQKNWR